MTLVLLRYFCHAEGISPEVNTYTLEVSMLGYHDDEFDVEVAYTDDTYGRTGRNMARYAHYVHLAIFYNQNFLLLLKLLVNVLSTFVK